MQIPLFKNDTELCQFAVDLYETGKLKKEVAKILGINQRTLYTKLKDFGFSVYKERSKGLTSQQETCIVELYSDGTTIKNIVSALNVTVQDVRKVLNKFDIRKRTPTDYRHINSNSSAFADPSTEESAYFYGWLLSDGCYTNGRISIGLHSKDIEILHNLKSYVGTNNKVCEYQYVNTESGKPILTASFSFKDDAVIQTLVNYGMEPRKSTKEKCPDVFRYNRHFWRGMVEGDGSISKTSNEVTLVGSEEVINAFSEYCLNLFPSSNPKIYVKGNLYVFSLCSKIYSKQVLDELYRDSKYKLSRKYNIYLEKYYGINAGGTS